MTVTSTQFLASVQRLIIQPSNQSLYSDDDFYAMGNRKMQDTIVPLLDSLNGEFFVKTTLVPIVTGTDTYRLPTRAVGRKLREVKLQNSAGNRFDFPQIAIEREQFYQVNGIPYGFYFKGDRFVVVPVPTGSDYSIQYWWFLGPSSIIPVSSAALVTGISGDDVTVSAVPSAITNGAVVDFIQGTAGNSCLDIDLTIQNIAGTVITFATGAVPLDLAVGDWISIAGTSPILQIPDSAVPLLETLTAMDAMQGNSDYESYDRLEKIAGAQTKSLSKLLAPRIEGEGIKIINDYGFVRRSWRGNWRGNTTG